MPTGASLLVASLLAACLAAAVTPATAAQGATVTSYSYTHDEPTRHESATLTPPSSTFRLSGTAGGVHVFVDSPSGFRTLSFQAPVGEQLTPGTYTGTKRFRGAGHAGMEVVHGNSCTEPYGSFTVRATSSAPTGEAVALRVTFEQHCGTEPGPTTTIRGTVEYAAPPPAPVVVTSSDPSTVAGQPVTFTADVAGAPSTGTVTFLDGGRVLGSAEVAGGLASLTTDALAVGGHSVVARYAGSAVHGRATSAPAPQTVRDGGTSFWYRSTGGDFVGQGGTASYDADQTTTFAVEGTASNVVFRIATDDHRWSAWFVAPDGGALAPGAYEGAERAPFQGAGRPGLDISGDGTPCNRSAGRFVVHEIRTDAAGNVLAFDADFVQHCELFPAPLSGRIRYHQTTKTALQVNPNWAPYEREDDIGFDVTVTALDADPTGTARITAEDGSTLCTASLSAGVGRCTLAPTQLVPGDYVVRATYEPDAAASAAGLRPSTSDVRTFFVQRARTSLTASPVVLGDAALQQRAVYRARLTSEVTGAGLPGQLVRFMPSPTTGLGGTCSAVTDADGVATCDVPVADAVAGGLVRGYTADFAGNDLYLPSSSSGAVTTG